MQVEVEKVWSDCLSIIKSELNENSYSTWFAPIVPLRFVNDTLTIQVPSQFFYECWKAMRCCSIAWLARLSVVDL